MSKLRTVMATPIADLAAACEAIALILAAMVLVRRVPLRRWQRQFGALPGPDAEVSATSAHDTAQARRIARIIQQAERNLPFMVLCLPQALAGRWMLSRRGTASQLTIGTRRDASGAIEFHAWLKCGETWVTGYHENTDFGIFRLPEQRG